MEGPQKGQWWERVDNGTLVFIAKVVGESALCEGWTKQRQHVFFGWVPLTTILSEFVRKENHLDRLPQL